ncbi:Ribonucleases P/MRP protein subunit POP1 [Gracilariopsis chorda]|uniref:Ribonucleases P/MRP protein subunit POP1 n=1 Tax=Gracilariopsis chorda TaxID=448386 RepID=A0A2V3IWN4_9FLOR|nr:Ribonucleases P/MRP protein subunit POP1 [Gracilariopsis chorda]|eukprot:PXF46552.1 Ribonucleases P/MRP protein subunit POP1 [Gracilariopsis chorda]
MAPSISRAPTTNNRSRPDRQRQVQNTTLDVVDFAVARALELRTLRNATSSSTGTRRVYQQLAWHGRRRTMSHSSRRMPARLRAAHAAQLAKQRPPGVPERQIGPKGAARCRKYRKKARFLKAIRKLRSKNEAWLETHIWHAKRFLMGNVGGRHVAMRCNDRGYRSAYRASARACVLHDASYLDIIEITGNVNKLKALLKAATGAHGSRVTTDPVVKGLRRVTNVIIMDGDRTVGPSDILWQPRSEVVPSAEGDVVMRESEEDTKVWVWIQPSLTDLVLRLLVNHATRTTKIQKLTFPPQIFSLFGPRSGIVLASVLQCKSIYFSHIARARSANCLPADCVFAGHAEDPRASFPPKRMSENAKLVGGTGDIGKAFQTVPVSELWHDKERELWKERIATGKGKSVLEEMPFILLQRPMSVAGGYDLLIPPGTGMIFWNSLMYANGARAIGVEEMRRLRIENLLEVFPEDFQDGAVGYSLMETEMLNKNEWYHRRPPAKRVNYTMNRIESPMIPDLSGVRDSEIRILSRKPKRPRLDPNVEIQDSIRIVRDRSLLEELLGTSLYQRLITNSSLKRGQQRQCLHSSTVVKEKNSMNNEATERHCKHFARVCIKPLSRGGPEKNGILCEPNVADMDSMRKLGAKYVGEREEKAEPKQGKTKPTREVVGYISLGGWSMSTGSPVATGFIALSALRRLPRAANVRNGGKKGVVVLFRNTDSLHYRGGIVTVLPPEV